MAAQTVSYDPRELSIRVSLDARLGAGIIAGIIGAILMLGTLAIYANATAAGWDTPLKALGAFVYGLDAYIAGAVPIVIGALIVLGFSIAVGIIFALCASRATSTIATMIIGILVGIAVWVAMELAVLPFWNSTMAARMALMPAAYAGAHILWGVGIGTTPVFARAFSRVRRSRSSRIRAAHAQPT